MTNITREEKWVNNWFINNQATYNYQGGFIELRGKDTVITELLNSMWADSQRDGSCLREPVINHWIEEWVNQQKSSIMGNYKVLLAQVPPNNDQHLQNWLKAVTGQILNTDLAVMKQFIWAVKRKLLGLEVEYHTMPIIYGAQQESGKSKAVMHLLSYIKDLVNDGGSLELVSDPRSSLVFRDSFVLFFDEMAYAERTDMEILKKNITSLHVSYRPMGHNNVVQVKNNATLIGCSNKSVKELIYDTTGVRRFWQINALVLCDWALVNSTTPSLIWGCVSPYIEAPILSCREEIREVQVNELQNKDSVELYVNYKYEKSTTGEKVRARELYTDYKMWCLEAGEKYTVSETTFGTKVKKYLQSNKDSKGTFYIVRYKDLCVGTSTIETKTLEEAFFND